MAAALMAEKTSGQKSKSGALITETTIEYRIAPAIAIIYFFFNSLFLPEGLQYTVLLTPFLAWWLWKNEKAYLFIPFLLITVIYAVIHFIVGVQVLYYLRSWALSFCAITFALAFWYHLYRYKDLDYIFRVVAIINVLLLPLAFLSFLIHPLNEYFWYYKPISPGVAIFPRLKMFTYESSYYSLLFSPLFIYFFLKAIVQSSGNAWRFCAIVVIPLVFSFSFGVAACMILTLAIVTITRFNYIIISKRRLTGFIIFLVMLLAFSGVVLFVLPDNPISHRFFNVLANKDTSLSGRTYEAFKLAFWIASEKSYWFGVGLGQIKVVGHDIIVNYYKYYDPHPVVRIPNSVAETAGMLGIAGLIIRFALLAWLFFKTHVSSNLFRYTIFIFIFLYQFTGSFVFNTAELTLWAMALAPVFHQFDLTNLQKGSVL